MDMKKEFALADTSALKTRLKHAPIVPLVQANDPETAVNITRALVAGGLTVVEVVLRSPAALECLKEVATAVPDAIVGAGTVLSAEQADACIDAGADFIVSPGLHVPVVEAAQNASLLIIPGVATASELQRAWNLGLRMLKFFPASQIGGPAMLKTFGSVFQDVEFMPTGGVSAENLKDYLTLTNVIACGGSWLTPESAVASGNFASITRLAAEAVEIAGMVEV
jgi:2-dehydro-3-deoxyphosphogluconate aldolase/(4S)-4-hydroxy-2-oxoglutarate aldolase